MNNSSLVNFSFNPLMRSSYGFKLMDTFEKSVIRPVSLNKSARRTFRCFFLRPNLRPWQKPRLSTLLSAVAAGKIRELA